MPAFEKPYNGEKPKFNEFITQVGKVVHCYHDEPQLQTTDSTPPKPVLDENGIQKADYKVTLWWPKSMLDGALIPLRQLAAQTRDEAWGPDAATDPWLNLQAFLRDGDNPEHNTKRKEYLFGGVYLNFKQKATPSRTPDGRVVYSGKPGLVGPYNEDLLPVDMYAGCEARVSGVMFGTMYSGKRFISTRLNNIQKGVEPVGVKWEKMGGSARPDARSQFDPLASGPAPGTGGGLGSLVL